MVVITSTIDGNHRYNCRKNPPIAVRELDPAAHLALKHNQLTSQRGILSLKSADRSERRNQKPQNEKEQRTLTWPFSASPSGAACASACCALFETPAVACMCVPKTSSV